MFQKRLFKKSCINRITTSTEIFQDSKACLVIDFWVVVFLITSLFFFNLHIHGKIYLKQYFCFLSFFLQFFLTCIKRTVLTIFFCRFTYLKIFIIIFVSVRFFVVSIFFSVCVLKKKIQNFKTCTYQNFNQNYP